MTSTSLTLMSTAQATCKRVSKRCGGGGEARRASNVRLRSMFAALTTATTHVTKKPKSPRLDRCCSVYLEGIV